LKDNPDYVPPEAWLCFIGLVVSVISVVIIGFVIIGSWFGWL